MSVTKKFVLLLKAQKNDEDEYEVILKDRGYIAQQIKTIDFNYVNLDKIKSKLLKPNNYSGIIFSSPRCVTAVKLALEHENLSDNWKLKDNYVVGETTYKTALKQLNLNCLGKDTGNADVLSQIMLRGSVIRTNNIGIRYQ
ncbi:uroporphyrinogen iii synthase [Holotrichia oblita]|uniref:Uroporphyrinogen iii synthase n=1 Tax=Holotrichia oblita TaxID=644536 RepID=A0ACB9T3M1_HOLOL|nr:uroporphyrinogen iii synthase [Holotrichia oblita]